MARESLLPIQQILEIGALSLKVGRYSAAAAYTLQVYEFFLCFGDEYTYIHRSRWSSIKIAYLVCRYCPLLFFPFYLWAWLGDHSVELCSQVVRPLYAFIIVFPLSAQAVILIRAFAFTGRNPWVLAILCTCYLALVVADVWLFGFRFVVIDALYILMGDSACFANDPQAESGNPFEYINATPTGLVMLGSFFFDFLMMAIVVGHCFRIRSVRGRLGKIFLAQGFSAFAVISALNLITACIYLGPHRQWDGVGLPIVIILPDIIACRLILTLRRKVNPSETTELRRHSMLVREALDNLDSWQGETLPPPIPLRWAGDSDVLHSRHSGLLDP